MGQTLCATAQELAKETWDLMGFGFRQRSRSADERMFTDHNMLWMRSLHPALVDVQLFTQAQESLTGADFEWWITDGNRYLGMLVQAKRIYSDGCYRSMRKRPRQPSQLDRLIDVCAHGQLAPAPAGLLSHLPLYLFYNGPLQKTFAGDRCAYVKDEHQRGCTLADARSVRRRVEASGPGSRYSLDRIGPVTMPWACLFCCPLHAGANPVEAVRDHIEGRFPGRPRETQRKRASPAWVRTAEEVPEYVFFAREMKGRDVEAQERLLDVRPAARMVVVTTLPSTVAD